MWQTSLPSDTMRSSFRQSPHRSPLRSRSSEQTLSVPKAHRRRLQNALSYGEHFEQQPIKTDDGDLYVSFWNSGDDYRIMERDELDGFIDGQSFDILSCI